MVLIIFAVGLGSKGRQSIVLARLIRLLEKGTGSDVMMSSKPSQLAGHRCLLPFPLADENDHHSGFRESCESGLAFAANGDFYFPDNAKLRAIPAVDARSHYPNSQ